MITLPMMEYSKEDAKICYDKMMEYGFDAVNFINQYSAPITSFKDKAIHRLIYDIKGLDIRKYDYKQFECPLDSVENVFPSILPNWDHTPRTGKKGILLL